MKNRRAFLLGIAATPAAFLPAPKTEVQPLTVSIDLKGAVQEAFRHLQSMIDERAVQAVADAQARGRIA
jgi:hypothetical protein